MEGGAVVLLAAVTVAGNTVALRARRARWRHVAEQYRASDLSARNGAAHSSQV